MRYEEYKETEHSWQPSIPKHWDYWRARRLFDNPKEKNANNEEKNVLSLTLKGVIRNDKNNPIGLAPSDYATYQLFDAGELVFKLIDLENVSTSRVGIVPERGIMSSAYIRFKPRNELNIRYFYYQYSDWYQRQVFNGLGAGVRQTLSAQDLLTLKIIVPPREEQDQIVRYLDWKVSCINKLIHGYQRQIKLLEERRLLAINEAITKGIENSTSLKDSGIRWIGKIPVHWHIVSLKRCATLRAGITLGKKYPRNVELIEIPYLRVANVQNGYIDTSDVATLLATQEEAEKYRLSAGEVLMTEGGDRDKLGRGSVWNGSISPCIHQNHVYAVRTNEKKLNNRFLEYLTVSNVAREYFDLTATKTTNLASTNSSKVLAFPIPLPPVDEQQQIVEYLIQFDEKIQIAKSKIQRQVSLMQEYRTRLISDVVTGQMDVRGVAVPEYVPEADEEGAELDETLSNADEETEV